MLALDTPPLPSPLREGTKTLRPNGGGDGGGETAIKKAFTLAEVLITLVVIGIIAAITVPMIHANYKKQETISKLKKTYSVLSQLVNRSQMDNGSIYEWYENSKNSSNIFNEFFKPYLRNAKVTYNYKQAGYEKSEPYTQLSGETRELAVGITDSSRASFLLDDGVFVMIFTKTGTKPQIYVDVNASKKPNKFGIDVFTMEVDLIKGVVPMCNNYSEKNVACSTSSSGLCCFERIVRDGWQIKDGYPWKL